MEHSSSTSERHADTPRGSHISWKSLQPSRQQLSSDLCLLLIPLYTQYLEEEEKATKNNMLHQILLSFVITVFYFLSFVIVFTQIKQNTRAIFDSIVVLIF